MPHSSSKRAREEAEDTEDTGTYPVHPPPGTPTEGDPTPRQDPQATTAAETPHLSPLRLREEALTAFLAQPMLPKPEHLELNHISALLAILVEGAWGETITQLLATLVLKKKASAICNTWRPCVSPPLPSNPTGEAEVKEEMLRLLTSTYTLPLADIEVARSVRVYAEMALTTAAFTENTSITLEDDLVQVTNTHARSPCLTDL